MAAIPDVHIETERFILRPVQFADVPTLHGALEDPRLRAPMRAQQGQSRWQTWKWVLRAKRGMRRGKRLDLVYVDKTTNEVIGVWSATNIDLKTHKVAEIALWIKPEYWRQGVLTEVEDHIETFFYRDLGLHRFVARMREDNTAIVGVMDARGWTFEARFRDYGCREDGSYCDFLQYSILSTDPAAIEAQRRAGYEPPPAPTDAEPAAAGAAQAHSA